MLPESEVGIYKRKQDSKKERKHAFDQESDQEKRKEKNDNGQEKKERKHARDEESKIQEITTMMKKKEGRKWKTQKLNI